MLYNRLIENVPETLIDTLCLNEELHELKGFKDCINDIEQLILKNNTNNVDYFYTGWNYKIIKVRGNKTLKAFKVSKENDESVDHPIYIKLETTGAYAAVENRVISNNIDLQHDPIIIHVNITDYNSSFIRISLKHEFTHVRQEFSELNFNNLNSLKNTTYLDTNVFNEKSNGLVKLILYLCTPTEQDAHINGLCQLIDELSDEELKEVCLTDKKFNRIETYIKKLLYYFDDAVKVCTFKQYINVIAEQMDYGNNITILYVGFYLYKHRLIKTYISKQDVLNKNYDKCDNIYKELTNIYRRYIHRVYSICYKKLNDRI